jgi:hypothetical protein
MTPRVALLLGVTAAMALGAVAGEPTGTTPPAVETGPALGWVFPLFTDAGYHLYTLRGSSARNVRADEIEVTGFSAVVFSGDATEHVDTVLLSPQATFFPKSNRATGDGPVRLIRDDVEVTGVGWTYDHAAKRVSLAHHVRVTFPAQLNDILK